MRWFGSFEERSLGVIWFEKSARSTSFDIIPSFVKKFFQVLLKINICTVWSNQDDLFLVTFISFILVSWGWFENKYRIIQWNQTTWQSYYGESGAVSRHWFWQFKHMEISWYKDLVEPRTWIYYQVLLTKRN